jgi:hypothetical protein
MGMDKQTDGQTEMGKTQGPKKMGYYLQNKPKNLLNSLTAIRFWREQKTPAP